ncbi:gamma-aminobutyraldehyde dehydrogenase [Nocardia terpenica]|uniref:gamma-aminobutyraldehyde dehydrogenase n=1 Tax=Nocardia terpenica TaxID=455432 RepID=UPI0018933F7D|nr:gamma-aminobutyraldehyde dehydrogenase [Nocardia terpenica]MBF6066342.1 gamma-aminobutyraldehyde dehydrogenase [Nocardia terpenica]MBF6108985.1 gamma-aminobutyraldehyde dehydrogenase [Nocardia terpenica]MBF6116589.1 gamma-aminobutyraldehyde dehydrogenase [Nocardia terpenica]MBF6121829.1 gamma-aminobutyraldehyde dehydrogenase [Nocardia terpenica]MBF6155627.1 gamma-aminobutyraldehyde dehydrogenase [Nocardia terpenica]
MGDTPLQYIAGERRHGAAERLAVVEPATGVEIVAGAAAGDADVDVAVRAAAEAFPGWAGRTPAERAEALSRWAEVLRGRAGELAALESRNGGKPIKLAEGFDIPGVIDNVAFFAGAARHLDGKAAAEYSGEHTSTIRREPIGVIGSIAPWNYPLQMAAWKVLPAVAAGNTVVLKPSELTPLTSLIFAETAVAAGIPPGVFNVVTGTGVVAGAALVAHPLVAMVSFTGSTAVGRQVAATAAGAVKRVHLELGGKAPFLVFDDADLEAAARGAVAGALINGGQDCTAATRAYVQRPRYDEFVRRVADLMDRVRIGPVGDPNTDLGALISVPHRDRVAAMVERARAAGAKVVRGGRIPDNAPAGGAYYEPTLLTDAAQDSEIVQQEVFGPVLVCLPFDTDDEGIALANDTVYGLAASAWSGNVFRTQRAAREIRSGCVWINDHIPIVSEMPHGGYRASGFGKDMSAYSFEEYTNVKHVMAELTAAPRKPWHDLIFRGD